jgi:leukotriene-A4 hydrolase
MKFVRKLYRDLYGWNDVRSVAIETFRKNRPTMMQVAGNNVAKDLQLS